MIPCLADPSGIIHHALPVCPFVLLISQTPLRHSEEEAALGRGVDGKRAAARRGGRRRDEGFVHILQGASVAKGLK